jgi:hypothetical protein
VHWIKSKLCDVLRFDGIDSIDTFLEKMIDMVPKTQRVQDMDALVKGTRARWWEMHYAYLQEWV